MFLIIHVLLFSEQLIRILQDAIAQRKAAQTQPSVILGGRRLSEDSVSVFVQSLKLNPNEAVSGVKVFFLNGLFSILDTYVANLI